MRILTPKDLAFTREKRRHQESHRSLLRKGRKRARQRQIDAERAFVRSMKGGN